MDASRQKGPLHPDVDVRLGRNDQSLGILLRSEGVSVVLIRNAKMSPVIGLVGL